MSRPTNYRRPAKSSPVLARQQPLEFTRNVPDPKSEARAMAALLARLDRFKNRANRQIEAAEMARTMMERGLQLPDVAQALGLSPVVPRASKPLNPWRLRPGSNMEIVAGMLEAAGTKGVTEDEMVAELQRCGRLTTATKPRRAVHWAVTELRRRTAFLEQRARREGLRWYCYGRFDVWRRPAARNPGEIKTRSPPRDPV
jgi:hypothetical protein